jgi:hypothetical protein
MELGLRGWTAVITGGSMGIGKAAARGQPGVTRPWKREPRQGSWGDLQRVKC